MRAHGTGMGAAFDASGVLAAPGRRRRRSTPEVFWSRVDKAGSVVRSELGACWEWTGRRDRDGYGMLTWCGRGVAAHRLAFSLARGSIAVGVVVRHRCDNPACCNPDHLTDGSIADNNRDIVERGHCSTAIGARTRGVDNVNARLDDQRVIELRACWLAGESMKSICARTGISVGAIHPMLYGRTWSHVPLDVGIVARRDALVARKQRST